MAELELHTEAEAADPLGKKIGILASVIAVFLAIVTIVSHRAHTDAVLMKSDANDKWSYYQSKRIKFHSLELGEDLVSVLGAKSADAQKMLDKYAAEKKKYAHDSDVAQEDAQRSGRESRACGSAGAALRFRRRPAGDRAGADFALLYFAIEIIPGHGSAQRGAGDRNRSVRYLL